ncbi:MAG: copper-binding protein [Xanthobacteraceae bacterium]|nr:copper-binding protein [Xanthobacteraceae bacterium]
MPASILAIAAAVTIGAGSPAALAQAPMVDGEVTKIDAPAGKITLRHGPIKNLDMDGMTMALRVQDPAMVKQVKVGDKVKFTAERVDGQITITKMQKAK